MRRTPQPIPMTDTPLSDDVVERVKSAIARAGSYNGMTLGDELSGIELGNAARAALEAARYGEMVKGLERIAEPYKHGHCGGCGKPCEGHTDDCCERNHWEPDDPELVARALLSSIGASQP
jgi:hypothetical protein